MVVVLRCKDYECESSHPQELRHIGVFLAVAERQSARQSHSIDCRR